MFFEIDSCRMAHRQIEMTNMAITYTTVLHSEVEKYGIEVAFTIANMDSLRRKNPRPDGGIVYLYELACLLRIFLVEVRLF